jgi:hypothetical protein
VKGTGARRADPDAFPAGRLPRRALVAPCAAVLDRDVSSTAGRVHSALDAADAPEPSAETVEVRARTMAGDVVVRRS